LRFDCSESHICLDYDGWPSISHEGNMEAQGYVLVALVFYLLNFDCNHAIQKPEVLDVSCC
jgi:hypothetical protein